jgi:hypothetical protein
MCYIWRWHLLVWYASSSVGVKLGNTSRAQKYVTLSVKEYEANALIAASAFATEEGINDRTIMNSLR